MHENTDEAEASFGDVDSDDDVRAYINAGADQKDLSHDDEHGGAHDHGGEEFPDRDPKE